MGKLEKLFFESLDYATLMKIGALLYFSKGYTAVKKKWKTEILVCVRPLKLQFYQFWSNVHNQPLQNTPNILKLFQDLMKTNWSPSQLYFQPQKVKSNKSMYYHGNHILRLFDTLPNFLFTISEMKRGIYELPHEASNNLRLRILEN